MPLLATPPITWAYKPSPSESLCQEVRQKRGELGEAFVTVRDGVAVHVGDRVLFRRNDRRVGVNNGDLATVVKITAADEESNQAATVRVRWTPLSRPKNGDPSLLSVRPS